jgi:hypothetical protein
MGFMVILRTTGGGWLRQQSGKTLRAQPPWAQSDEERYAPRESMPRLARKVGTVPYRGPARRHLNFD